MRGLTPGQRSALKKANDKYFKEHGVYPAVVWDLPEYETIEAMNCTEVFVQKADQFILDLFFSQQQKERGRLI